MTVAPKNLVRLAAVAASVCAGLLIFKLSDAPKPKIEVPARIEEPWETAPTGEPESVRNAVASANETPNLALSGDAVSPPARSFHVFYRDGRAAEYIRGDTLRVESDSYLIDDTSGGMPRTVAAIPISAAESITDTASELSNTPR